MNRFYYGLAICLIASSAIAHELTPTYPELRPSYFNDVSVTTMKMWNRRNDVQYYEIGVFDKEWNPVPFASPSRLLKMDYLEHKSFEIYIRDKDVAKVKYICTVSKQLKSDVQSTGVKSRICSKMK